MTGDDLRILAVMLDTAQEILAAAQKRYESAVEKRDGGEPSDEEKIFSKALNFAITGLDIARDNLNGIAEVE